MTPDGTAPFLSYHEPGIISILTLVSFFVLLSIGGWLADKTVHAALIGHIVVGLVYGAPLGNILVPAWQETFLALGYIGLILIIFEGGLTIRLDILRQNLLLSIAAALIGILVPIALSFGLLHGAFHHTPLESFIVATSLSSTSLGTTMVLLSRSSTSKPGPDLGRESGSGTDEKPSIKTDFSQTRVGTLLIGAALLDDVVGLVLVSVIHNLRDISSDGNDGPSLSWIIGRPVLASVLMAVLTPVVARWAVQPVYRGVVGMPAVVRAWKRHGGHVANALVMVAVLAAFLAIAAYAGASVLFGAFLAGGFVSALAGAADTREAGEVLPVFTETFDHYVEGVKRYMLEPWFFASIGFAIPFLDLWSGEVIWKGIVYTVFMALGKLLVGVVVPIWDCISLRRKGTASEAPGDRAVTPNWAPATLLGAAMVARGEIGLLIIQIGLNETPFLSQKAFLIGIWAIVLNTLIGPVLVGILLKRSGSAIANDARWGIQIKHISEPDQAGEPTGDGSPQPAFGLG
ncbi:hypothetical protein VTK26DRAFT_9002 [Humicola hyalothermophila]